MGAAATVEVHLTLALGNIRQTVEVKATATPVESETATQGHVVDTQQFTELPVLGRNMGNVLMWQAGISNLRQPDNNAATDVFGIERWTINGNYYGTHTTVDGVENNRTNGCCAEIGMTSIDDIQEAVILTSNYTAEYGRGGGAQEIFVTKSGTRSFHGEGFDFIQNTDFNARSYFSTTVSAIEQNQFGGDIGGPVVIPGHFNTDKTKRSSSSRMRPSSCVAMLSPPVSYQRPWSARATLPAPASAHSPRSPSTRLPIRRFWWNRPLERAGAIMDRR